MRSGWRVLLVWSMGVNAATVLAQPAPPPLVTDARRLPSDRNPGKPVMFLAHLGYDVYGVNHFDRDEDKRAHGKDERIGIRQFDEAARFGYELAKMTGQ